MASGISAWRHSHKPSVTVAIDNIHFASAIHVGDIVTVRAQVDYAGKISMEVGIVVYSQDTKNGIDKKCLDGHFTFVALDEYGKPASVPEIVPETDEEKVKYFEANERRKNRRSS